MIELLIFIGAAFIVIDIWWHFEIWSAKKSGPVLSSEEVLEICDNKIEEEKFNLWYKICRITEIIYIKRVLIKFGIIIFFVGILLKYVLN